MDASIDRKLETADGAAAPVHAVSGLTQQARDLLDVIRQIDSAAKGPHPEINRDEIDDALGRAPGNEATRHALNELDAIGDLENVTRSGSAREPISFTLA